METADDDSQDCTEYENTLKMCLAADEFAADVDRQRAFEVHGNAVRETLVTENISVPSSPENFDEIRVFSDRYDNVATAHIVAEQNDGTREIEFHVLPQTDETFAVKKTESGLRRFESDDVKPAKICNTSTYCDGYCRCAAPEPDCDPNCNAGYEVKERCCQYNGGSYECETLNRTCTDSCPENACS